MSLNINVKASITYVQVKAGFHARTVINTPAATHSRQSKLAKLTGKQRNM